MEENLARNIGFEVADCEVPTKIRKQTAILKPQILKIGRSLARNARSDAPTCIVSSIGFPVSSLCLGGKSAKPLPFEGVKAGCHVVLRGRRRGTS